MRMLLLTCSLLAACARGDIDPLVGAVREGDAATTESLIAQGADPNRPSGVNGWPPLMHAVHKNQLAAAETLLEHGADVNRTDPNGVSALMMAAGYGNNAMVGLLLRHHADVLARDRGGDTALDYALGGMSDIDSFTLLRCQDSTVALLIRSDSRLRGTAHRTARTLAALKRCASDIYTTRKTTFPK
ncbi:MAG TPA: ankyrin repeat domain-containing protein [Thermoanaerobaculia bacterium]|nr:ankyrin repeat domain-containing protein [Thermoanaerobaculia bacterium]